ncbi:MAG: PIN domain-containing protein [Thiothrix sp.]|nr:MAG: PIN domain-containing protein [Thiothrix sp.]
MIGLDTNILVRYITQDEPAQTELVNRFMEEQLTEQEPAVISHIVLCEVAWVLSRAYHYSRQQVGEVIHSILTCREFSVESADLAILAWQDYLQGHADFSDYLLSRVHQCLGASYTLTFDRKAAHSGLFQLLQ